MEKYEIILELLEKENLSDDEKIFLEKESKNDDNAKKLINVFNSLKSTLAASQHIDPEILASFVLNEKEDEPDFKNISLIEEKIRTHLKQCDKCKLEYENLKTEYAEVDKHISSNINSKSIETSKRKNSSNFGFFKTFAGFRYALATAVVVCVIYLGLLTTSNFITPEFKKDLVTSESENFITRGRTSLQFQKAIDANEKGNFGDAITYLKQDINQNKNESSIFYTHYILGIIYLKDAESDFLGLFTSFDSKKVQMAVENFIIAIQKNNTGSYTNVTLDTYYYLGRSYLLLEDFDSAYENFSMVVEKKGRFYREAEEFLISLEKN